MSSFLLLSAAGADGVRVLRGGGSKFLLQEYLFDDLLHRNDDHEEGRTLESCCQPIGYRTYELKNVHDVKGRQGISTNGTHYFNSGSTALYTYDYEGNLLKENEDPFATLELPANHLGDISYYDGEIYTGIEWFVDGRGEDIQIVLYDSETLNATQTFHWEPASGQVEVSALTVDTDNGLVWMTDWVNGNYIYSYYVTDGAYVGKLHLRAVPEWTQGIAFYKGDLYITADDGNADRKEHDNLWKVQGESIGDNATFIRHELEFTVPDHFKDFGEIEGIAFNEDTDEMIVLANRGKRIVLGMPQGFYPGYDKEIHELFVFRIIDEDSQTEDPEGVAPSTVSNTTDSDVVIVNSTSDGSDTSDAANIFDVAANSTNGSTDTSNTTDEQADIASSATGFSSFASMALTASWLALTVTLI